MHAGANRAVPIDARVLVEPLVLGDLERLADDDRDVAQGDERAALESDLGDEAAVSSVELRGLARGVVLEDVDRRTLIATTDEGPAGVSQAEAEGDEECCEDGPSWAAARPVGRAAAASTRRGWRRRKVRKKATEAVRVVETRS